jgi:hypothetical protein
VDRPALPGRDIKFAFNPISWPSNHAVARGWPAPGFTANLSLTDRRTDRRGAGGWPVTAARAPSKCIRLRNVPKEHSDLLSLWRATKRLNSAEVTGLEGAAEVCPRPDFAILGGVGSGVRCGLDMERDAGFHGLTMRP